MVEAAGIKPLFPLNTNPMMAYDFGLYLLKILELRRRFESPGVPWSPPQSWRYIGDGHTARWVIGLQHHGPCSQHRSMLHDVDRLRMGAR